MALALIPKLQGCLVRPATHMGTGLAPEKNVQFLILFPRTVLVHSVAGPAGGALPVS